MLAPALRISTNTSPHATHNTGLCKNPLRFQTKALSFGVWSAESGARRNPERESSRACCSRKNSRVCTIRGDALFSRHSQTLEDFFSRIVLSPCRFLCESLVVILCKCPTMRARDLARFLQCRKNADCVLWRTDPIEVNPSIGRARCKDRVRERVRLCKRCAKFLLRHPEILSFMEDTRWLEYKRWPT